MPDPKPDYPNMHEATGGTNTDKPGMSFSSVVSAIGNRMAHGPSIFTKPMTSQELSGGEAPKR